MPRARCQIARHIVKYTTPRAVGNIMFSLGSFLPGPRLPWPFHLQPPSVPTVHPPRASPPSSLPSRFLTPARPSRFANKFARRTAIVLTSKQLQRPLPEIHFSVSRDITRRDDIIYLRKKNNCCNCGKF